MQRDSNQRDDVSGDCRRVFGENSASDGIRREPELLEEIALETVRLALDLAINAEERYTVEPERNGEHYISDRKVPDLLRDLSAH